MKAFLISLLLSLILVSCNQESKKSSGKGGESSFDQSLFLQISNADLSSKEEERVIFMLEEEKLARDVYLYFAQRYNQQIFVNISNSEQKHMNLIMMLIEKYQINFSVFPEHGIFYNSELQKLYDSLIEKGENSLLNALDVGRSIELLDISDLKKELDGAPEDFQLVYQNLFRANALNSSI